MNAGLAHDIQRGENKIFRSKTCFVYLLEYHILNMSPYYLVEN